MSTRSRISRYLRHWPLNKLLTTRQVLHLGSRNAVDQSMASLVRVGAIVRVAWGVFVREGSDLTKITPLAVAQVKARAFEKQLIEHQIDTAKRLKIIDDGNNICVYSTAGHSSSFRFLPTNTRVYVKGISNRKFRLSGSLMPSTLGALWQLGRKNCGSLTFNKAMTPLNRSDRDQIFDLASLMPGWIHKKFKAHWEHGRLVMRQAFERPR